jgi:hypothetical protein
MAQDDKNTRKVLKSVLVHRDDKPLYPPIGKKFTFTDAELKDIADLNPSALQAPSAEETDDEVFVPTEDTPVKPPKGGNKPAPTPAPAAKDDDDL